MIFNCPGSQKFKHPQPEETKCVHCGGAVEIWTDEADAICPKCRKITTRPSGQSCIEWCKHAKECVGGKMYYRYMKIKKSSKR